MRGGNIVASGKWAKSAARWAFRGGMLGVLAGPLVAVLAGGPAEDRLLTFAATVIGLALTFATVPAVIAIWFLFLHMLWQAGRAARGVEDDRGG